MSCCLQCEAAKFIRFGYLTKCVIQSNKRVSFLDEMHGIDTPLKRVDDYAETDK